MVKDPKKTGRCFKKIVVQVCRDDRSLELGRRGARLRTAADRNLFLGWKHEEP